jgi:hypothetical protein
MGHEEVNGHWRETQEMVALNKNDEPHDDAEWCPNGYSSTLDVVAEELNCLRLERDNQSKATYQNTIDKS